jgi:hypothetical protein
MTKTSYASEEAQQTKHPARRKGSLLTDELRVVSCLVILGGRLPSERSVLEGCSAMVKVR